MDKMSFLYNNKIYTIKINFKRFNNNLMKIILKFKYKDVNIASITFIS